MFREFLRATSIEQTLTLIEQTSAPYRVIAGGTDLLLQAQSGKYDQPMALISIGDVEELSRIKVSPDGLLIGAATKLADIEHSDLFTDGLQVLIEGVREVGSPQIRNLATIGGNICNASPSADTIPPLLVLEASAVILSPLGKRTVPLTEFFLSPGKTVLERNELLADIIIPALPATARGKYIKLKTRGALDLAIVSVAVMLSDKAGRFDPRIALGAVAPTPIRAKSAEAFLAEEQSIDDAVIRQAAILASLEAYPISDVRASAAYRKEMVRTLTARALQQAITEQEKYAA
jgi:CO/xanthine dehydrogenase FAD-binding subunit